MQCGRLLGVGRARDDNIDDSPVLLTLLTQVQQYLDNDNMCGGEVTEKTKGKGGRAEVSRLDDSISTLDNLAALSG